MKYLLESNPAFIILEVDNDEYVFYNSLQHVGARLTRLELSLLDLVYTYQDIEYLVSKFPENQRKTIHNAILGIENHNLLNCEGIKYTKKETNSFPTEYYIHLTYRCNLQCQYCYNKSIRRNYQQDMTTDEWIQIIDKVLPYAKRIIFTGGECFLHNGFARIATYIKSQKPSVVLSAISNGTLDYKAIAEPNIFNYLSELSLSCDSLDSEGKRVGFKPEIFKNNIEWVKRHYPHIALTLASVYTCENSKEIEKTERYCLENHMSFDKTILIPESAEEIELMPSINEIYENNKFIHKNSEIRRLDSPRIRCGAGKTTCSIDPMGNVFPCQSLHYDELSMGNLLTTAIESLNYNSKMLTVDDIPVCSKCNVKYICGGGCFATGYSFYKHKQDRNHLTCHLNRHNAIEILKSLNNRLK